MTIQRASILVAKGGIEPPTLLGPANPYDLMEVFSDFKALSVPY
jgi:hypothetical protein